MIVLVLGETVGGDTLQPGGKALVQLGARLLGERLVGRVANQQVAEPIRLVAGKRSLVRPNQLHAHQARQPLPDLPPHRLRRQLHDGSAVEDLALHRSPLDDRSLLAAETVEASGEQGLDTGRDDELTDIA